MSRLSGDLAGDSPSPLAIAATVAATCLGYYVASLLGMQLSLPGATTSLLWPPNAVLTSALLLTPPRRWPLMLLCVLPVHILLQIPTGRPLAFITVLFVTNCSEAICAAGGLRLFTRTPWRLDTVRGLTIFLAVVVVAAPALSSFGDAAAVWWFRGEPYWVVWERRTFSNILSELAVVPALVGVTVGILRVRRSTAWRRVAEAVVLGLSVAGAGWLQVSQPFNESWVLTLSSRAPMTLQLPLILWASLRFGPTGAGLSLLTMSTLTVWGVVHGVGPFASVAPATAATAVTVSLIMVATTILYLAALTAERRQAQQELARRLEFEGLLSRFSGALVQLGSNGMQRAFHEWLGRIGAVLDLDAITVFAASSATGALRSECAWIARQQGLSATEVTAAHLRLADLALASRKAVHVCGGPDWGLLCGGAMPLLVEGSVVGAITFGSIAETPPLEVTANVGLLNELLANALSRKRSEDAMRASEGMNAAILQSLQAGVAVVDSSGRLLQVNSRWQQSLRGYEWMDVAVGASLLEAAIDGPASAADVAAGMSAVLGGVRTHFVVEQATGQPSQAAWWTLTIAPLHRPQGGAVLIRTDLTDLRQAESEAQRSREALAHVARVSTVGEMTASLAHQLNQPLTAILANAQAARRMFAMPVPDYAGIKLILADIVADDRRAADVVQHLRDFLRKGEFAMAKLSLPAVIQEVVNLVHSEALMRTITITIDCEPGTRFVRADRVQLQQVIINLLHNAMDAIGDTTGTREVMIACRNRTNGDVLMSVSDSGAGLEDGTEELVFDPFYTTKPDGMGMGLSIVRSIVTAHGGSVQGRPKGGRGAVFEVTLPQFRVARGAAGGIVYDAVDGAGL